MNMTHASPPEIRENPRVAGPTLPNNFVAAASTDVHTLTYNSVFSKCCSIRSGFRDSFVRKLSLAHWPLDTIVIHRARNLWHTTVWGDSPFLAVPPRTRRPRKYPDSARLALFEAWHVNCKSHPRNFHPFDRHAVNHHDRRPFSCQPSSCSRFHYSAALCRCRAAEHRPVAAVRSWWTTTGEEKPLTLSPADLAKLPRAKVQAEVGKKHLTYEGVPLAEIVRVAGAKWGGKCSSLLDCYLLAEERGRFSRGVLPARRSIPVCVTRW